MDDGRRLDRRGELEIGNGQLARQTFEFEILTEARDDGMTGMDHDADMAEMDHSARTVNQAPSICK